MDNIKLPRSSYDELTKIITAYAKVTNPAGLDEISKLTGIGKTKVSDNNAFLTAIGIIEGGKAKLATPKGADLGHALEHNLADEIAANWSVVIAESDFLSKILQAISIRRGMDPSQLEAHVAYSSGESKSPAVMTGSRTVVDILRASNLVAEVDGQIRPVDAGTKQAGVSDLSIKVADTVAVAEAKTEPRIESEGIGVTFSVNLQISVTASELEGLGDKIKELLRSLKEPAITDSDRPK